MMTQDINQPLGMMFQHIDSITTVPVNIVCKKFLPLIEGGGYNLISGRGGLGKSMIALRSMVHYLMDNPNRNGLAIFTEDDRDEINKRLFTICRNEFGMNDATIITLKNRMFFKTVDTPSPMKLVSKNRDGVLIQQTFFELTQFLIDNNVGFVVFDPLKAFHDVDENFNSDMDVVMRDCFQRLGAETHSCVVVLHHSSKGSSGARGASTIEDSSRISYNLDRFMVMGDAGRHVPDEDKNGQIKVTVGKDTKNIFHEHCRVLDDQNGLVVFPMNRGVVSFEHGAVEVHEFKMDDNDAISMSVDVGDIGTETGQIVGSTPSDDPLHSDGTKGDKNPLMTFSFKYSETDAGATHGWKTHQLPFPEFATMVQEPNIHYSASQWHGGHRLGDNYFGNEQFIVFDIDDGMTFHDAVERFKDYNAMLVTTKSHQIEKNGVVCDRFRVIIPFTTPMDIMDNELLRLTKIKIYQAFGADEQVANLASKFKGSPKGCIGEWTNGDKLFDWKPFMTQANSEREHKRYLQDQKRLAGADFSDLGDDQIVKSLTTYFANNNDDGNRNNTMSATIMFGKNEGLQPHLIVEVAKRLNDASGNGLPDNEMNGLFKHHLGLTG